MPSGALMRRVPGSFGRTKKQSRCRIGIFLVDSSIWTVHMALRTLPTAPHWQVITLEKQIVLHEGAGDTPWGFWNNRGTLNTGPPSCAGGNSETVAFSHQRQCE